MSAVRRRLLKRQKRVDAILAEARLRLGPQRVKLDTDRQQGKDAIREDLTRRGMFHTSMYPKACQAADLKYVESLAPCWVKCLFEIVRSGGIALDPLTIALLIDGGNTAAAGWTGPLIREHTREEQLSGLTGIKIKINTFDRKVGGIIKHEIADAIKIQARDVTRERKIARRTWCALWSMRLLIAVVVVVLAFLLRGIGQGWTRQAEPTSQPASTPVNAPGR